MQTRMTLTSPRVIQQTGKVAQNSKEKLWLKNFEPMVNKQTNARLSPYNGQREPCAIIGRKKSCGRFECPENNLKQMDRLDFMVVCSFIIACLNYRNFNENHVEWATAYFGKAQSQGIMLGEIPDDESNYSK